MRSESRMRAGRRGANPGLLFLGILALAAWKLPEAQLFAEEAQSPASASTPAAASALPAGFSSRDGENALRRFEVIAFGAFPIMLFYADFGIDLGLFAINGFDMRYAPWPFKSELSIAPTEGDRLFRLGVAAGASIAVAVTDIIIRTMRARSAQRKAAASIQRPEAGIGEGSGSATSPPLGTSP